MKREARLEVLVVPDKFKGTLTAPQAARAIARGWSRARPGDRLRLLPMSDGGDGFGPAIALQGRGRRRRIPMVDAAGRPGSAPWWWLPREKTAVIESARVVGLAQLPRGRYHPFDLDTRGLGMVIGRLERRGVRRFLIGLGGSATNDGGFGMARELGWRFLDSRGRPLRRWRKLESLDVVEPPAGDWPGNLDVRIAVDVRNPLLGARGASRIYGPQKGLSGKDIPRAEACLAQLADASARRTGRDDSRREGAGAAGGLGFGAFAFLGAEAASGYQVFSRMARLEERMGKSDLVITGEGMVDSTSTMGKGVGEVLAGCRRLGVPSLVLAGECRTVPRKGWHAMVPQVSGAEEAMAHPGRILSRLAARVAGSWPG